MDNEQFKPGEITKLIPLVMRDIDPIAKNRRNQQQGYSFRGIDDIYNELHPLLSKHSIFIVPFLVDLKREERPTRDNKGVLFYTHAIIDHRFYAPDGSFITARTIGEAMDSGDKSSNKAQSAAMKYACIEVFSIPTEGDNDTENQSPQPAARPSVPQAAPQQDAKPSPATSAAKAGAAAVDWVTAAQVAEIKALLDVVRLPKGLVERWFAKADVDNWEDMPSSAIGKCIDYVKSRLPAASPIVPPQPAMTFDEFSNRAESLSQQKNLSPLVHGDAMAKFISHYGGGEPDKIPAQVLVEALAAMEHRNDFSYSDGTYRKSGDAQAAA